MPLPDERPRGTVANLIGRFEQGTKRQSISAEGSPRPLLPMSSGSSVLSHSTGGSVVPDERREWRPSNMQVQSPPVTQPLLSPSPSPSPALATSPPPATEPEPMPVAESEPTPTAAAPAKAPASVAKSRSANATPAKKAPAASPPINHSGSGSVAKSPSAAAREKAATKPPAKPRASAISQPLRAQNTGSSIKAQNTGQSIKPQHTGQSAISPSAAARKAAASASVTPSRPKTPSRAKTPSARPSVAASPAGTSRPKTPSGGLFAPTAASLARAARNAPMPSTPAKKVLSSDVADRLTKPTAASASKMRAVVSPPPTKGKATSRGAPAAAKGKAPASATSRPRKVNETTANAQPTIAATAISDIPDEDSHDHIQGNGFSDSNEGSAAETRSAQSVEASVEPESVSDAADEFVDSPTPAGKTSLPQEEDGDLTDAPAEVPSHASPKLSSLPHTPEPVPVPSDSEPEHETTISASTEEPHVENEEQDTSSVHSEKDVSAPTQASEMEAGTHSDSEEPSSKAAPTANDDLLDIVNLLESGGPSQRPISIVDIPKEMKDIPDEE